MSTPPPGSKTTDPRGDYGSPRNEILDVVLLKNGVAAHTASSGDFRRINVAAEGTYEAAQLPEIEAAEKEGYTVLQVVKPGFMNEHERAARDRDNAGNMTDRRNI